MVSTADVIRMAFTQYGHPYSGDFDSVNGNHPWAYWCLSFVDSSNRNCGLNVPLYPNAVTAGHNYDLQQGDAPPGAALFMNENFYYPDGHAALSVGGGWAISTVTNGTGIGMMWLPPSTHGMMGWAFYDGVEEVEMPTEPPLSWYVQPDNPYSEVLGKEVGIGGGFLRFYQGIAIGQDPMTVLGYAMDTEQTATVVDEDGSSKERTIQLFQRGTLIYQPETPFPFDVVMALSTQQIT